MLREVLKDKKYFDSQIKELDELNIKQKNKLRDNKVKEENVPDYMEGIFDFNMRKVFCMYSRGDEVEAIKKVYLEAIESYHDAFKVKGIRYDPFSDWDFPTVLAMLSLAILFDIEEEPLEKLLEVILSIPSKYKIINYFLSYFIEVKQIAIPDKLESAFKNFNKMIDMSNEEIESKKHMDKYLKTWLKHHLRGFLTNTHNDFTDIYVGYWSFESAAFVKMRGLDDSSFRDSPYYPKDLL